MLHFVILLVVLSVSVPAIFGSGLHHSVVEEETNSNYSTIFSWWDRLNGSFRMITEAHTVTIGVPYDRALALDPNNP
jgi:hypothetical protein